MRKLLFLVPLSLGVSQAKTAVSSTTLVFQVPVGAKTVVVELDGDSRVSPIIGKSGKFAVNVALSASGVRYAYAMKDDTVSSEVTSETQTNLKYTPFTRKQLRFAPSLNTWTSLPLGEALSRWKITFGNGQGLRKKNNQLSLSVLFTQKPTEKVREGLRPPQKP